MLRTKAGLRPVRWVFVGIRWVTPWLFRLVWHLAHRAYLGGLTWVRFLPRAVRRIAYHWLLQAVNAGLPTEYEDGVYYGSGVVTIWMALIGWVAAAYLTIWLLRLIVRVPLF